MKPITITRSGEISCKVVSGKLDCIIKDVDEFTEKDINVLPVMARNLFVHPSSVHRDIDKIEGDYGYDISFIGENGTLIIPVVRGTVCKKEEGDVLACEVP